MDAVMFIKERKRMCDSLDSCVNCPLNDDVCGDCDIWVSLNAESAVNSVEKWSVHHPRKTRQSVFLEQYPNAKVNAEGTVEICPCNVEKNMQNVIYCNSLSCSDCRREFWMQEVK